MYYYLYKILNLINNKIYIGVHQTTNLDDGYMGSGKILQYAKYKYGIENFEKEILQQFNSSEEMYKAESIIVNEKFVKDIQTYNIKAGGVGGWDHIFSISKYRKNLKGKVPVKDKDGNTMQVSIDDPRYLSGELVHVCTNRIITKNKYNKYENVKNDDLRYLAGELVGIAKGKVVVKNKSGNKFQVSVDDPRYLSGELVHVSKGRVTVKDKSGNTMSVSVDDPRYLSGELVGANKGTKHPGVNKHKVPVKDKAGNKFQVSVDDPRYLSGELVHVSKGSSRKKRGKQIKIKCPHCDTYASKPMATRWHFDNCKLKGNNEKR